MNRILVVLVGVVLGGWIGIRIGWNLRESPVATSPSPPTKELTEWQIAQRRLAFSLVEEAYQCGRNTELVHTMALLKQASPTLYGGIVVPSTCGCDWLSISNRFYKTWMP